MSETNCDVDGPPWASEMVFSLLTGCVRRVVVDIVAGRVERRVGSWVLGVGEGECEGEG